MTTKKLVSDKQGTETSRLGRSVDLERSLYQKALTDGTMTSVLEAIRDGCPITFGPAPTDIKYPDWVVERLTPELEVTKATDPVKVELWLDPRQKSSSKPTGNQVYEVHQQNGLLERALSLGNLKFYEENPDKIPTEWKEKGLWVYGWASVVRYADGSRCVPFLSCSAARPFVRWYCLGFQWLALGTSGLRAS